MPADRHPTNPDVASKLSLAEKSQLSLFDPS